MIPDQVFYRLPWTRERAVLFRARGARIRGEEGEG